MFLNSNNTGFILKTMLYLANQTDPTSNNSIEGYYNLPVGADADIKQPKCYGVYGCFPITSPWTTETRPVSLYPESPTKINPKYPVFNRETRLLPKFLDLNEPEATRNAGINPKGKIYFVSHGYIESGDRPWIQNMVNALIDENPNDIESVIVIDWGGGSSPPYTQAVANIRLVGAITAHIIYMIYEELKLKNLDKVHLIGHSLGAHLCGYAGFTLQRDFGLKLGRITGLDPAEPLFSKTDPIVRLDKTDATYVDIIHSDAQPFISGGLGMIKPIGHVDFYPNGGYNNPGCDAPMEDYILAEKGSFFWGVQTFVSCNHLRSHQFLIDSIKAKCPFMAISCDSYEDFRNGLCFRCGHDEHHCLQFGLRSIDSYNQLAFKPSKPIKAYLMTDGKPPYCRSHYRVTLNISSGIESVMHGGEIGKMSIIIHSHHNTESNRMQFTEEAIYYEPGKSYSMVMAGTDVGIPKFATLNWEYTANPLNPLTWRILTSPRVYIDNIVVESLEHRSRLELCPFNKYPILTDNPNPFRHEYCSNFVNKTLSNTFWNRTLEKIEPDYNTYI